MNTTKDAFIFGFVKQCHALNLDVETAVVLLEAAHTKELYANESFQKGFLKQAAGPIQGALQILGRVAAPLAHYGDKALGLGARGAGAVLKPLFKTPGRALATTAVGGAGYGVTKGVNAFNELRDEAELGRALSGPEGSGGDSSGGGSSSGTANPFDYIDRSYNSMSGADLLKGKSRGGSSTGGGNNGALSAARESHAGLLQSKQDLQESMRTARPTDRVRLGIQAKELDKQIADSGKRQQILNKQVGRADALRKNQANTALANVNTAIPKYQQQLDRHMELANRPPSFLQRLVTTVPGGGNFVTRWRDREQEKSYEKAQKAADRLQQLQDRQAPLNEAANYVSNADYQ